MSTRSRGVPPLVENSPVNCRRDPAASTVYDLRIGGIGGTSEYKQLSAYSTYSIRFRRVMVRAVS